MTTSWCQVLGIDPPDLASVARHSQANTFALLICALLERDEPMTLREVAARLAAIGWADEGRALLSLQRCKPGRPPVYRDGDRYHLDPHDDELDLWVFRLDLRPGDRMRVERRPPPVVEVPGPEVPLTFAELDEAWKVARISGWSAQRLALAVLDAQQGPLPPAEVIAAVEQRTHAVYALRGRGTEQFGRKGSPVVVLADGRWAIDPLAVEAVRGTRKAVRERVALARKHAAVRLDPAVLAANVAAAERRREAHRAELERLRRALIVAFPPHRPVAAALVDVGERTVRTFLADRFDDLRGALATYDVLGGIDVRGLLRALGVEAGDRRLAELGPPQKSRQLNQRGRTLKITTELLIRGSCGIDQPFGEAGALARYLDSGDESKLVRRLESDAKALCALYEYGRLHGCLRLRWGFLDERIPAPWVHRDEAMLHDLKRLALELQRPLEVVVGNAAGWADPWSRGFQAFVGSDGSPWRTWLVDERGDAISEPDIQRARLVEPPPEDWN